MEKFIIQGGATLSGEIPVYGAKNTTDKCLAACLLTDEECVLDNVPDIADIRNLLAIFESMGVRVVREENRRVRIQAKDIDPTKINQELVRKMRMSVLLFGALLARFPEVKMAGPGGDKIGARQITTHLDGFVRLGAEVSLEGDLHVLRTKKLVGTRIILDEFSPTATVNVLLACALAEGTSYIKNAAAEPQIDNVMQLLQAMGAKVRWVGNHLIEVVGVKKLHGAEHSINPDYLEMWTFTALAAATKSDMRIRPFIPEYLELEMLHLKEMGVPFAMEGDALHVMPVQKLIAPKQHIKCMPFPGFAADNLPPFVVLATQAAGQTQVMDWMYEGRQKYVYDLIRMGADISILDPHRVLIKGPTALTARETTSYDVRAGATMIIAALVAQGTSVVTDVENTDRGYEKIEDRLSALGAQIERVKE